MDSIIADDEDGVTGSTEVGLLDPCRQIPMSPGNSPHAKSAEYQIEPTASSTLGSMSALAEITGQPCESHWGAETLIWREVQRCSIILRECAKLWTGLVFGNEMDNQAGI